jgi:hypothetical protein
MSLLGLSGRRSGFFVDVDVLEDAMESAAPSRGRMGAFGGWLAVAGPSQFQRVRVVRVDFNWMRDDQVRAFQDAVEGGPADLGELLLARDEDGTERLGAVVTRDREVIGLRIIPVMAFDGFRVSQPIAYGQAPSPATRLLDASLATAAAE